MLPWSPAMQDDKHLQDFAQKARLLLQVKMRLGDDQLKSPEAIFQKISHRMERGHFYIEKMEVAGERQIITVSELQQHRRYIVTFHYAGVLRTDLNEKRDEVIIKNLQSMLLGGEMALGGYKAAPERPVENHCNEALNPTDEAIVEIGLMVNEFNIDFHDNDSVYYYVMDQLEQCGSSLAYKYQVMAEERTTACIGLEVYCSYQPLAMDDYDDLKQQL